MASVLLFAATLTGVAGCGAGYPVVDLKTGVSVAITTSTVPAGNVGSTYNAAISVAHGVPPYAFKIDAGTLPAGLTLSSAGVLGGMPTVAGTYTFTVGVTDQTLEHTSAPFALVVGDKLSAVTFGSSALTDGMVGAAYSTTLPAAAGGTAPYTYALTAGALPAGLAVSAGGVLSGTPLAAGTFSFTVSATDAAQQTASAGFSLNVAPAAPLVMTTPALGPGEVTFSYTAPFFADGGVKPYTFAITAGAIPAGLSFTAAGILSGTPTASGIGNFTVTVTDALGTRASKPYSLTIYSTDPLKLTTPALGPGETTYAYTAPFYAANGVPPYTFAVTAGAIPSGMTFTSAGVLSGTPTAASTYNFTVTVTDSVAATASGNYTLKIVTNDPVRITTPALGPGWEGARYDAPFYAAAGTAPYSWAVTGGTLPPGLTFAAAGMLSGVTTTPGDYSFTMTVTDINGGTASKLYSLHVNSNTSTTPAPLTVGATLADATVNTTYAGTLAISGGTAPYNVTLASGTLPAGLTLSAAGVVSGTPTTAGAANFTVSVTDSGSPQMQTSASVSVKVVSATGTTVTVDTTTTLATIPQTAYGIFTAVYDNKFFDLAGLPALLAKTGTTMLRYPGGGYSDSYHWAQHIITPLYATPNPACGQLHNGYLAANTDFGSFIKLMQATGTQAVITVNYGTSLADSKGTRSYGSDGQNTCSEPNAAGQPQEAAAWVAYANGDPASTQSLGIDSVGYNWKTVGFWASLRAATPLATDDGFNFLRLGLKAPVGVKYWEVGNEMYYNGWDGNRNFEDDLHAPFLWPNGYSGGYYLSRDQVTALGPTSYGNNSVAFIQAMKAVDPTIKIGVDFSSPVVDPISLDWNPDLMQAVCAGANIDLAIMHYYTGTYQSVQAAEMLDNPQTELPTLVPRLRAQLAQYCPANARNMEVVLTETSPNGYVSGNVPGPVVGLFATNVMLSALQQGITNVDWLELHGGNFLDNNDNPQPAFFGIELAHLLAGVGDKLVPARTTGGSIEAFASVKADGTRGVLLINSDPTNAADVTVTLPGSALSGTATLYTYGTATTQAGPALSSTQIAVSGTAFHVTVPPYTGITVILQ